MSEEFCVVYESQGPLGAEVARSKLESAGIPCMLRYEAIGRVLGLTVDGLGLVQVLVAPQDLERAQEILQESPANPETFLEEAESKSGGQTMAKRSLGARTLLFPTPVLVVGTYDPEGRPNAMTAAWGGVCCSRPPCIAVALRAATYTHGNIHRGKCFTVSIPSERYVREADYIGLATGREVNKFEALGLTPVRAEHVEAPYVGEFPVVLECRLVQAVELGSHTQFIGEVVDVKAEEGVLDAEGHPDIEQIKPLIFDTGKRRYYGIGPFLGDAFSIGRTSS